jgi:hypothetical protein
MTAMNTTHAAVTNSKMATISSLMAMSMRVWKSGSGA